MEAKNTVKTPAQQMEIIGHGVVDVIQKKELLEKLKQNRALIVKAGFDPSRPDIHLGHSILINKLRQFQELGHSVVFIVGDFTACIGDPSGQNKIRPTISKKQAAQNAKTYIQQVTKNHDTDFNFDQDKVKKYLEDKQIKINALDKKMKQVFYFLKKLDPKKTKFEYNSKWLDGLSLSSFLMDIASKLTVARQLERNDFATRYQQQKPIGMHEFFYPVLQAYDSYHIKADVELGGTDQLFNLLLGRELQQNFDEKPQSVLTLSLLEGLDGIQKMSKSLDNYIAYNEPPKDIYGKIMKISDDLLFKYWDLFTANKDETDENGSDHANPKKDLSGSSEGSHARSNKTFTGNLSGSDYKNLKQALAYTIVSSLCGYEAASKAEAEFVKVFAGGGLPSNILEKNIKPNQNLWICSLLKDLGLSPSTSEAKRQVLAGAVRKDGEKIQNTEQKLTLNPGDNFLLSIGKRKFVRVKVL